MADVVVKAGDLFGHPKLAHRSFFRWLDHPELGDHDVLTQSFQIGGTRLGPSRPAPLLGKYTHDIWRAILGLSEEEIATRAAKGLFEWL